MTLSTRRCPGALHSIATNLTSEEKPLNFIQGMCYRVFSRSMGTLNLHGTCLLPQNTTTLIPSGEIEFITRCTQEIGGGQYRCANLFCISSEIYALKQTTLESHRPGATVILVIISSDKTQLTLFRGKTAYPVYLTIGNIPKDIRRKPSSHAQILIAYVPTNKLEGITNKAARRHAIANLFHTCMQAALAPITTYGETGIAMMSGDGIWRRCHPIFSCFVGDYPEQALVTCTLYG